MSPIGRIAAAVGSLGEETLASHRSAALLWGAHVAAPEVDVLVPLRRRPAPRTAVRIHRSRSGLDLAPSSRRGIPCTNPLRTLVDFGAVEPDRVGHLLAEFAIARLVVPSVVPSVLDRHSKPGRTGLLALRSALREWPLGNDVPDSHLEISVARLLRDHGLGGFVFHPRIEGFEVDFAHRGAQLVIESDGFEFHSSRAAFEEDRRRDAVLASAGWQVVRITWRAIERDPGRVAAGIRAALNRRRG